MAVKKINKTTIEYNGIRYIQEDSKGWLNIPELGIAVEIEVHDKGKSWNKLNLSEREKELPTDEDCKFLANHPKYSKILKMDGSSSEDDFFIQQPFELNRKKGYVARFYADSDYVGLSTDRVAGGSYSDLGVRFCKKISKAKKK